MALRRYTFFIIKFQLLVFGDVLVFFINLTYRALSLSFWSEENSPT